MNYHLKINGEIDHVVIDTQQKKRNSHHIIIQILRSSLRKHTKVI